MKKLRTIILIILIVVFVGSGGALVYVNMRLGNEKETLKEVESLIEQPADEPDDPAIPVPEATPMDKYGLIYERNSDFIGWLEIDGTDISYPVMHTPEDGEKYLHLDFNGKYAFGGTLFADGASTVQEPSDNIIIYGHNMKNGTMFGSLSDYSDKAFYEAHPTFTFDTIYEFGEYEIIAVFHGEILEKGEEGFKYYRFINAEDEAAYDESIAAIKARSIYDIEATAAYGDKLVTLSTCERNSRSGRFVVVARKMA